jgi:hypothetical protein
MVFYIAAINLRGTKLTGDAIVWLRQDCGNLWSNQVINMPSLNISVKNLPLKKPVKSMS